MPERIHDDILFATVVARPEDGKVLIKCLAEGCGLLTQGIKRIDLLGSANGLAFARKPDGLSVTLPKAVPGRHALVLRICLEPRVNHRRLQDPTHEHGPSYDS